LAVAAAVAVGAGRVASSGASDGHRAQASAFAHALSVTANPAQRSRDPLGGMTLALRAGIHGYLVADKWSDLEPKAGRYSLGDVRDMADLGGKLHLKLLLGLEVINTTAKETPRDLQHAAFDSPAMIDRFQRLVDAIRPYLNRNVKYLSIGNEVDVYLSAHPSEWSAYTRFYRAAAARVHGLAPWIKVGVTTTFDGLRRDARRVRELNSASDVQITTYYPLGSGLRVRSPASPLADFKAMLRFAGRRPLVLQEVGYPSAPRLGSSPAKQATFVRSVFRAWSLAGRRIPFLNFYLLHDWPRSTCVQMAAYYGAVDQNFIAYLCSLGLRRADGRPKPAWSAFADSAARARPAATPVYVSVNAGGRMLEIRPKRIHLVSDENLTGLQWSSWGGAAARARGTDQANFPSPGHRGTNPVQVQATGRRRCGRKLVYTTIRLHYPRGVPYEGARRDSEFKYGCPG
jgi:hypothetical protein